MAADAVELAETSPEDGRDPVHPILAALLCAIALGGAAWLADLPQRLGMAILLERYLALMAGLACAAGLLAHPIGARVRGIDLALAGAAFAAWAWSAWNYADWLLDVADRGPTKWLPGAVALGLLLEALRRSCGGAIAALVGAIGAYGFLGHVLPGPIGAEWIEPRRLILYLYADSNGVPGLVLGVAATVVLGFIAFGAALRAAGGAEVFTLVALRLMGSFRGGPAKVAILASGLFGTISGSTVANIMSSGVVTIPLMKRSGFPAHYAAGIEAVASNGGQLAPPVMGAAAFLIAEFLQVPYVEVAAAALIPALIYYLVLFMQVDAYAAERGLRGLSRAELPPVGETLRRGWVFALPIAALIALMFQLAWPPGRAALAAAILCLVVAPLHLRRLPGRAFWGRLAIETGQAMVPLLLVSAAAGIVVGVVNLSGVGFTLTLMLGKVGAAWGMLPLLALSALAAIVLGMGMPTAAVYVVLSVLLAPALVRAGVEPMAAHLFILYFGLMSMITPPVAIGSYAAASIAGASFWPAGLVGLRLSIAAYLLPFAFCLNPALLLRGTAIEIAVAVASALAAGYLLARALVASGHLRRLVLAATALGLTALGLVLAPTSPLVVAAALLAVAAERLLRPAPLNLATKDRPPCP